MSSLPRTMGPCQRRTHCLSNTLSQDRRLQFSLTVKPDRRWYVGWRLLAINPVAVEKVRFPENQPEIGDQKCIHT